MSQGWSTLRWNWPRGRSPRRNSPGWRRFGVSRRRARSSRLKSRLPRSWNFLKRRVALILSNAAAAASILLLGLSAHALAIQLRLEKEFAADGRVDAHVLEEIAE